ARCYRGKGQKMAAARDAKLAAEAGCGGKSKEEGDALGLIIAARALKKGPRSKHGPGTDQSSRKRTGTGRDASAYGLIVAPLVFTLLSAVSLYYLSATESTNLMIGSVRGIEKSQLARLGAGAFGILLVLFAVLLGTPAGRNRGRR
ncbi:hypothetical protein, partial [Candidatus Ichthyocystis hellenicum]|uniref:hypothetical protein n=2 Tax=Candidatus Ichthyocystis TaxID=2929841 RepID=UPI001F5F4554